MKRKIYAIMILILISISMPFVSFARTYINEEGVTDSTEVEEDDDEEENDSEDDETEPTEPTTEVIGPGEGIEPGEGDSTGEGVSYTNPFETINGRKYWVGWRKYHYNFTATPTARKGEEVTYTYRIINTSTHTEETRTGSAIAKGYGLYSMDYNKHILGLLYYMSRKIISNNYLSSYVPDDVLEFNSDGTQVEQEYRLMDVACKEVADRIVETFYSSDYEQGKFKEFWEGSFTGDKANILGKLQSEFYCNAYAVNAIRKLESMHFPFDEVTSKERAALYGMIFSIMEARYRNKNLNGKTNLQLKVSEGDLWPFLVYCKNITAKKDGSNFIYTYEWPDIDKVVDGAYQWMYYYDSKFETSTSASTITSLMVQNEADDEVDGADWEEEYIELTNGESFPYLNASDLQIFYNNVAKVRSTFKKSKENSQGIFGAEEVYDITSEVSYSVAMQDMKKAMVDMCKGTELSKVWKGLTAENIARTYMMAKNIMENERVQEEYAYYNIGTNVINATPGLQGNEYMLVDFERIRLEQPLRVKDKNGNATVKTYADTDKDGLYDRDELGRDGETFDYYDITKFIEKMVLAELYGSHYKEVDRLPEVRKEGITYLTKAQIKDIMTNFKKHLIRRRKEDSASDESKESVLSSANTVDPKEQAEYYLNCFKNEDTEGSLYAKEEDAETAKIKVELYKFDSNPIFKDTDFDGVPDGKGEIELLKLQAAYGVDSLGKVNVSNPKELMKDDEEPQNNEIRGSIITKESVINNANTHMDYRYFFMNNKNYYDELSTMSLLICNLIKRDGQFDFDDITTLFRKIGLKRRDDPTEVEIKIAQSDRSIMSFFGSSGEIPYVVGENDIEYTHNYGEKTMSKKVKLIAIGEIGLDRDNIDKIGKNSRDKAYSRNHHELFEKLAKDIYTYEYKGNDYCYWVSGYGTGGAVANILSAMMIDSGKYYIPKGGIGTSSNAYITYDKGQESTQSKHGQVISNVYCYTFGSPYTIYNGKDNIEEGSNVLVSGQSSIYCSIFNVINEDDILAYMPSSLLGFSRYGVQVVLHSNGEIKTTSEAIESVKKKDGSEGYRYSGNKQIRIEIEKAFNRVFKKDIERVRKLYEEDIGLQKVFKDIIQKFTARENLIFIIQNINNNTYKFDEDIKADLIQFTTLLNAEYNTSMVDRQVVDGIDSGSYYYLSKAMLPENITMMVDSGVGKMESSVITEKSPIMESLEKLGEWYVDNVYTYLAGNYGAERNINGLIKSYDYMPSDENNGKVISEYNWHFPTNDEEYKKNFINRFNEMYAKANGTDFKDQEGKMIKKSTKTKRIDNIIALSNSLLDEKYLDILTGDKIDENWQKFELCTRNSRGQEEIVGSETVKVPANTLPNQSIEIEVIIATKSVIKGKSERGSYKCDILKDKNAYDDCSAFASEVIWLFIQDNEIGDYKSYKSPSYWGSGAFLKTKDDLKNDKSKELMPVYKLEKYGFKQYTAKEIVEINKKTEFKLKSGDLLCTSGHVEFYKGETNSNSFGWGDVHNSYDNNTGYTFTLNADGSYKESGSKGRDYSIVYRFEGLN